TPGPPVQPGVSRRCVRTAKVPPNFLVHYARLVPYRAYDGTVRKYVVPAIGLVLALLLGVGWIGYRGNQARGHLGAAAQLFVQLKQQVESGDAGSAKRTLVSLRRETDAARDETAGPAWSIGTVLPKVGDDMAAARTIAASLDLLADDGLPPLLDAASGLEAAVLAPKNGRIDLAALRQAAPSIAKANAVITNVRARIAAIPTKDLDAS